MESNDRSLAQAALVRTTLDLERQIVADKAHEWAAHYSEGSDGRNTFVLLAEWVESRIGAVASTPPCGGTSAQPRILADPASLSEKPLTAPQLADALDAFWNAALNATRQAQDSTASAVVGAMVEGISAIARELRD